MSMVSFTLARSQTHLAASVSRGCEPPLHREVRSRARREVSAFFVIYLAAELISSSALQLKGLHDCRVLTTDPNELSWTGNSRSCRTYS